MKNKKINYYSKRETLKKIDKNILKCSYIEIIFQACYFCDNLTDKDFDIDYSNIEKYKKEKNEAINNIWDKGWRFIKQNKKISFACPQCIKRLKKENIK